jgi:hypothetical protein
MNRPRGPWDLPEPPPRARPPAPEGLGCGGFLFAFAASFLCWTVLAWLARAAGLR